MYVRKLDGVKVLADSINTGLEKLRDAAADVEKIKAAIPSATVYVYAADHGFNCNHRGSHDAVAAKIALDRTLSFFSQHIG